MKIYLDDVRTPIEPGWTVVRDYWEFCKLVFATGLENIEAISLDHDLGDTAMSEYYNNVKPNSTLDYRNIQEMTGMDCCKYIVHRSMDTGIPLPKIVIHSANPVGAGNMLGYINNYLKNCKLPQTCVIAPIPHTYIDPMTDEERLAKYTKPKQ